MTDITVRVVGGADGEYVYRCGATTNGIDWAARGCSHATPREAVDHAAAMTVDIVARLRDRRHQ